MRIARARRISLGSNRLRAGGAGHDVWVCGSEHVLNIFLDLLNKVDSLDLGHHDLDGLLDSLLRVIGARLKLLRHSRDLQGLLLDLEYLFGVR